MLEVQVRPSRKFLQVSGGADFQMPVLPAEIGCPHVVFGRIPKQPLIDQQGRVQEHALDPGPFADDAERVLAPGQHHLRVLAGPPKDQMGPLPYRVPPDLADFGVVKEGPAVGQTEHQGVHGRPRQLVHRRLELLPLHGGFVHVDGRVAAVVGEHDPGYRRARRAPPFADRLTASLGQARRESSGQGGQKEAPAFHTRSSNSLVSQRNQAYCRPSDRSARGSSTRSPPRSEDCLRAISTSKA